MAFRVLILLIHIVIVLLPAQICAQWSTSTYAESALYVCPGLYSNALVFDDGSSIIAGTLASYIYLQKLDPAGYPLWSQPVVAHYNDSTDNWGNAGVISDGKGGVILIWKDHRGAYYDQFGYWNEAYYLQRVDKDGNVCWTPGGVLAAPAISGTKAGNFFPDGKGGAILAWIEKGYTYQYPTAPNRSNLKIARFDENGNKLWEKIIDSLFKDKMFHQDFKRAGKYLYLEYRLVDSLNRDNYLTRIIDTTGFSPNDSVLYGYKSYVSWKDSVLFVLSENPRSIRKIDNQGNTLWETIFNTPSSGCNGAIFQYSFLLPDKRGGAYYLHICHDTVYHFNTDGSYSRPYLEGIASFGSISGAAFVDKEAGLTVINELGYVQRYDSIGTPLWGSVPIIYQSDPDNSYFEGYWGDNNGGVIVTYWTTGRGGVLAQHTGRFGNVGVVGIKSTEELPQSFQLHQNYPNPFNAQTTIRFDLPSHSRVKLTVYDVLGKVISTLIDEYLMPNTYTINFSGNQLASGVYYYELQTNDIRKIKPMLLIK